MISQDFAVKVKELFQEKGTGGLSPAEAGGMMRSGGERFPAEMIPAEPAQPLEWLSGS